jgi:hypothetical protein
MSQDDQVLLAMILAHGNGIFLKGDVEHPVEAIFDLYWLLGPSVQKIDGFGLPSFVFRVIFSNECAK